MRITAMLAMVAVADASAWAGSIPGARTPAPEGSVVVCMKLAADAQQLVVAERTASKMFAEIGVVLQWPRQASCEKGAIVVTLSYNTSPTDHPDAWAYALPYEGSQIVVFWDRVQQKMPAGRAPLLLAHVLAHEIAHILEGTIRHSESGVMKAKWDSEDLFQMGKKPLGFAETDVWLIRLAMEKRSSAVVAAR